MSQTSKVKPGDVIDLNIRFKVHSVEHHGPGSHGPSFTALTYAVGEPRQDGRVNEFTFELPDEFGRVVILDAGVSAL